MFHSFVLPPVSRTTFNTPTPSKGTDPGGGGRGLVSP